MFLVRLIDVFVGILEFVFKSDKRAQGASPAVLGTAGIITLVALLLLATGVPHWRYLARSEPYAAELGNAAGLTTSDPVLIAGVPAGRIEAVRLAGDRVRVEFRLDRKQPLGDQTRATVRLRTVLGKRYFELVPGGRGPVGPDNTIPLNRTDAAYTLDDISADALRSSTDVDPTVVRAMLNTMESMVPDSQQLSSTLAGAGGAALAISGTGAQLDQLLGIAKRLAQATAGQSDSVSTAMANTQAIVQTLVVRRYVLTRLADNLRLVLAKMAQTFPRIPMAELTTNIMAVTGTLKANAATIDEILKKLPPAMRTITDATGNGNWADVVSPSAVIPDGLLCVLGTMQGCS
ncbi:Mce family protein [Gordonia araii NBRC 100433]|uniref:Mce family protein n=1 Tax=Gordonia araii NBRC 100433 TaxID=1073574 RepID=G7H5N5_9ACTN|nr:MlaD family protein [Gordonia araii]NNG95872.1 MCE family protein [Gordonia araii NBRC 100433]GAB11160.1 Mce family protein [Gordonia araii NBRC 100433]